MNWRSLVITCLALVSFWAMWNYPVVFPYPVKVRFHARSTAHYNPQWPISKTDYQEAMKVLKPRLSFFEFIHHVHVSGPGKIDIMTTRRYRGFLDGGGFTFTLKKENNRWVIDSFGVWHS